MSQSSFRALVFAGAAMVTSTTGHVVPPAEGVLEARYAEWAHRHWVWLQGGSGNQEACGELIDGYLSRDITLGALNIDSQWATAFNSFNENKEKWPDMGTFFDWLHEQDIRVTMWMTSFINADNPDFDFANEQGFLVRTGNGEQCVPIPWWHGDFGGCLLDYTNPAALDWWHSMMNNVIDYGVDGFKCDASDPYVMAYKVLGGGAVNYEGREIEYREYANLYYRDALLYPRERRAATGRPDQDATLIMGRPIDCLIKEPAHDPNDANGVGRDGFCFEYAPRDTMFSGWVGDEYGTWSGLENCLRKMVASAWRGYANFGCDIGGYRQDPDFQPGTGRTSRLFVRWTELMAFMPLMENGGGGEHRPWELENVGPDPTSNSTDDTVVDIYRKYVNIHHTLIPYLHTVGSNAIDAGTSAMVPTAQPRSPEITLVECLVENDCVKFDFESPVEDRDGGLGVCLISNECIQFDDADNLDVASLTACVQRIPIVNPNPPCESYIDAVGALACVAACHDDDVVCQATCLLGSITFGDGLETFRACTKGTGACAAADWSESIMPGPEITDWSYMLGPDLFVAPITHGGNVVEVTFPEVKPDADGEQQQQQLWVDWWDESLIFVEGATVQYEADLEKFPVFIRAGAVLPLREGKMQDADGITFSCWRPWMDGRTTTAEVRMENQHGISITYTATADDALRFRVSAHPLMKRALLKLRALPFAAEPAKIRVSVTSDSGGIQQLQYQEMGVGNVVLEGSWTVMDGVVTVNMGSLEMGAEIHVEGL